jgi:hypothetical protein
VLFEQLPGALDHDIIQVEQTVLAQTQRREVSSETAIVGVADPPLTSATIERAGDLYNTDPRRNQAMIGGWICQGDNQALPSSRIWRLTRTLLST